MNKKSLSVFAVSMLMANLAIARVGLPGALPLDDGSLLAVAAACLTLGIRIVQRKRNR
jgi:hypothetical protein